MTLYELAVVAVPLLAISLVLDPRPVRPPAAAGRSRRRQFVGLLLTMILALVAVILSAMVVIGLMEAGGSLETIVGATLFGAMLLLCWFTARQMRRPVTSDAAHETGAKADQQQPGQAETSTIIVGITAFATLCLGIALVTTS